MFRSIGVGCTSNEKGNCPCLVFLNLNQQREAEHIARQDRNELECVLEIAQQYADGKYGVTHEYAVRCYDEYIKLGAYDRNRTPTVDKILEGVLANIKRGERRDHS